MGKLHHTKNKGDIGLTKVIADLEEKGYGTCLPLSEHLPYDLITDLNGELKRVQVKYSNDGIAKSVTNHVNSNGKAVRKKYNLNDFEIYGLYLPDKNVCAYIPFFSNQTMVKIRTTIPNSYSYFYWYEDFLDPNIKFLPEKRNIFDFYENPIVFGNIGNKGGDNIKIRKIKERPSKEELEKMIKESNFCAIGRKYGVSDNAIRKWARKYGII